MFSGSSLIAHRSWRVIVLLLFCSGCIHRSLTIRSEPPGAALFINDKPKGETPVTYDFTWYGWYRVELEKDGYHRLVDRRQIRAPWFLWIPIDLVMELVPWTVRDEHAWHYSLTRREEPPPGPLEELLQKEGRPDMFPIPDINDDARREPVEGEEENDESRDSAAPNEQS